MNKNTAELRKWCLEIAAEGQDGNLQSVFSSIEIIYTLYARIFDITKIKERHPARDIFVLSKGQSTLGLLTVLAEVGILQKEELKGFCKYDSRISMQADYTKFENGIENAAGSLGHGFPMAVGMAMASKIKKIDNRIYCLVGDGEMNEGTMWEACTLAVDKRLDNLCLIIDDNNSIGRMINMGNMQKKLEAFGFQCYSVDGHNIEQLEEVIKASYRIERMPVAIFARTIRGYGSKTLMENREWFHKYPKAEELQKLIQEVDEFEKSNG